jgi:hypothetical protein
MDNETELNLNTPFGQIQMKAINPGFNPHFGKD